MNDINAALKAVQESVSKHEPGDKSSHARMLDSIQRLQIAAQGPQNYAATLRFQFAQAPFLIFAVESGILDTIVAKKGAPVSAADIAAQSSQDQLLVESIDQLLVRTMRVLNALKIAEETGVREYASNAVSESLVTKEQKAGLRWSAELLWPVAGNFAAYIQQAGVHQFPQSASQKGPFEFQFGSPMFEFLETHETEKAHFDEYFASRKYGLTESWFDIYPIHERIRPSVGHDSKPEQVFIVDVGGNRGQDLVSLAKACPPARSAGRLIVQDLPSTVESLSTTPDGIEFMAYDFFTPQPVQGAKYYFTHHICHDWSDEKAQSILSNTAEAMNQDSRLLLHEFVLPDKDAPMRAALFDACMMLLVCGMERTLDQWTRLLDLSGLQIVKVWHPRGSGEAVIESKLKA